MNDQIGIEKGTREDEEIRMILHEAEYATRTADPGHLITVAKRRRRRNLSAMAASSLVVATLAVGGATQLAGRGGAGETELPAAQAPVQSNSAPQALPAGIGTIPANRRVEIATKYWFETKGSYWRITRQDGGGIVTQVGWRQTVGNRNIGDGRHPGLRTTSAAVPGQAVVSSVFRADAHRVRYRIDNRWHEAKVYRLAGIPGWVLSVAEFRPRDNELASMAQAVYAYDAKGRLIASYDPFR